MSNRDLELQKLSLFVHDVIDFSSQYGKEFSKSYTVANIRSDPVHFPRYGDFLESCVLVNKKNINKFPSTGSN